MSVADVAALNPNLDAATIDGELEVIDTAIYYNRVFKKDYAVALNLTGSGVDDPDARATVAREGQGAILGVGL